jgi:uncharacterized membrane protein YdbT with pleckstrin-like domain
VMSDDREDREEKREKGKEGKEEEEEEEDEDEEREARSEERMVTIGTHMRYKNILRYVSLIRGRNYNGAVRLIRSSPHAH